LNPGWIRQAQVRGRWEIRTRNTTGGGLRWIFVILYAAFLLVCAQATWASPSPPADAASFPPDLQSYGDEQLPGVAAILQHRIQAQPFNLVATLIFLAAIIHTFLTSRFLAVAHRWEHKHALKVARGEADRHSVHHGAEIFHFLGEVEAVFGIWAVALLVAIVGFFDWPTAVNYVTHKVNFTEAMFVVVIMTLAATRPILRLTERIMAGIAGLLGGSLVAWWLTILTIGPLLGSFITEPAAMTIVALLLVNKFYTLAPSNQLKYATIGLLFVNISVGGTLTQFAAPPVLMVAAPWGWDMSFMLGHFGWKAALGILLANGVYLAYFRREMSGLQEKFAVAQLKHEIERTYLGRREMDAAFDEVMSRIRDERGTRDQLAETIDDLITQTRAALEKRYVPRMVEQGLDRALVEEAFDKRFEEIRLRELRRLVPALLPPEKRAPFFDPTWDNRDDAVPAWVTLVHVVFLGWTVLNAHYPPLFIAGLLFFLGFALVTSPYQNRIDLKPPLLVGFFLGGLVVHGGLQGWWIAPVLGSLTEIPLMVSAVVLTAFNDNAAITYLSTLVPDFTEGLKYAVVAGAVTGGGLTVIANAPNPAGQSILKNHFENGVSPTGLLAGAIVPTMIMLAMFMIFS
jgi:hypothetical protein